MSKWPSDTTGLLAALTRVKCYNCGEKLTDTRPPLMRDAFLGFAADPRFKRDPRLPFWKEGHCPDCHPARAAIRALDPTIGA